jgi:hypothetical protein
MRHRAGKCPQTSAIAALMNGFWRNIRHGGPSQGFSRLTISLSANQNNCAGNLIASRPCSVRGALSAYPACDNPQGRPRSSGACPQNGRKTSGHGIRGIFLRARRRRPRLRQGPHGAGDVHGTGLHVPEGQNRVDLTPPASSLSFSVAFAPHGPSSQDQVFRSRRPGAVARARRGSRTCFTRSWRLWPRILARDTSGPTH